MNRPDSFDFAMDFLGTPEDEDVICYVESLEKESADLKSELKVATIALENIKEHIQLISGASYKYSASWNIANYALNKIKKEGKQ